MNPPSRSASRIDLADGIAILPLRNRVLFPGSLLPIDISRPSSEKLVHDALTRGQVIGVVTQRDSAMEDPSLDDLYSVGCLARVTQSEGGLVLQGLSRFRLIELLPRSRKLWARVCLEPDLAVDAAQTVGPQAELFALASAAYATQGGDAAALKSLLAAYPSLGECVDFLAGQLPLPPAFAQRLLQTLQPIERAQLVCMALRDLIGPAAAEAAKPASPRSSSDPSAYRSKAASAVSDASSVQAGRAAVLPADSAPGRVVYICMQPFRRAAFLDRAAALGWCFADRSPATLTRPESLHFIASASTIHSTIHYQHQELLDVALIDVEDGATGRALAAALSDGGRTWLPADALLDALEADHAHVDPVRMVSALSALHALHGSRDESDRLHAAILRCLDRADAEARLFASVALSGLSPCAACSALLSTAIVQDEDPRLSNFTATWLRRQATGPFAAWQAGIAARSVPSAAWWVSDIVSHRDLLRALWRAGYAPFQIGDQRIHGVPHAVQIWFAGDGLLRVRFDSSVETPVPLRLLSADGDCPDRLRAALHAQGLALQSVDDLVQEVVQQRDAAQIAEGLARVFYTAQDTDAARFLPPLRPLCAHPDPQVQRALLAGLQSAPWPAASSVLADVLADLAGSRFSSIADAAKSLLTGRFIADPPPRSAASMLAAGASTWPDTSQPETLFFVPALDRKRLLRALSPCRFVRCLPDEGGRQLGTLWLRTLDRRTSLRLVLDGVAQGHVLAISGDDRASIIDRLRQAGLDAHAQADVDQRCKRSRGAPRQAWLLVQQALNRQSIQI